MRSTIKDVSTKTVSRVLNKEKYVSEETRLRVERAVTELKFTPSLAARVLAGKRSHQVALLYDNHSPHYIHQIQTGVWARCVEEGVRLLAQPTDVAFGDLAHQVGELIDQPLPFAPRFKMDLSGRYTLPVTSAWNVELESDYAWQSRPRHRRYVGILARKDF